MLVIVISCQSSGIRNFDFHNAHQTVKKQIPVSQSLTCPYKKYQLRLVFSVFRLSEYEITEYCNGIVTNSL